MAMSRVLHSKKQRQELLADFWHNHFNLFGLHYLVAPLFVHYDRDTQILASHSEKTETDWGQAVMADIVYT